MNEAYYDKVQLRPQVDDLDILISWRFHKIDMTISVAMSFSENEITNSNE